MAGKRRAVDNGYNYHKVAWVEDGEIKTLKYQAVVGNPNDPITDLNGGFSNMYESEGERLVCDPEVGTPITLRTGDYGLTSANRMLVARGLRESGITPDDEVYLMTSLPVRDFFNSDGSKNEALINGQKQSMMKPVHLVVNNKDEPKRVANVTRSDVVSEAVAAAFDFLVENVGEGIQEIFGPIAVLDFGGSTFDLVSLTKDLRIRQASSGTLKRGAMDIIEPLKRKLIAHLQSIDISVHDISNDQINDVIETRHYKYYDRDSSGKRHQRKIPVHDIIDSAASETVSEIKQFVKQHIPNFSEYQAILLVGGGSLMCERLFADWEKLPNFIVMDEFANARGMLKLSAI